MKIEELIARIEAATGADHDLEADIALTQGWHELPGDNWLGPRAEICVPAYTASIDAAVTLVPEWFGWSLATRDARLDAEVWEPGEGGRSWASTAVTPALALCAAALRAQQESEK